MLMYQRLKTKNDRNGNSRRLYAIYNPDGSVDQVLVENGMGLGVFTIMALDPHKMIELPEVYITVGEYNSWINHPSRR